LGWYGVFFKEVGSLQNAVNGAIWRWSNSQLGTFPFNGGDPDLGKGIFFQLDTDFLDQLLQSR
jgi:hypothetical protein